MAIINLSISGMSCENCVNSIKTAIANIDGVSKVDVQLKDSFANIEFDKDKTSSEQLKEVIESIGFEVN